MLIREGVPRCRTYAAAMERTLAIYALYLSYSNRPPPHPPLISQRDVQRISKMTEHRLALGILEIQMIQKGGNADTPPERYCPICRSLAPMRLPALNYILISVFVLERLRADVF